MGDSTGKRAYALQLLAGEELVLRPFLFRDVMARADHPNHCSALICGALDNCLHPTHFSVRPDSPEFYLNGRRTRTDLFVRFDESGPVRRMNTFEECHSIRWIA